MQTENTTEKQRLYELCKNFIEDQEISCAETVYQNDRVIANAYELIEEICEIVGYFDDDE